MPPEIIPHPSPRSLAIVQFLAIEQEIVGLRKQGYSLGSIYSECRGKGLFSRSYSTFCRIMRLRFPDISKKTYKKNKNANVSIHEHRPNVAGGPQVIDAAKGSKMRDKFSHDEIY
jgi:hypothetical protein